MEFFTVSCLVFGTFEIAVYELFQPRASRVAVIQFRVNGLRRFDLPPEGGLGLGVVGTRVHGHPY
jgi:hypothetical protein